MFKLIWRTLFFCCILVVGWSIYQFVIRPSGALGWDEAAHSLRGLVIAHDLKSGDWLGFLYDTYRQVYWPPLHSWLTGIAFLVWGPSTISARTVSLILFLLTALVIYVAALQFRQPQREVAATVATSLFLTSPPMVLFSAQAMLEIPGLFFLSLSLLVYIWLNSAPRSPAAHMWLGLTIALAYFTRTNYGVLLIVVVATTALLGAGVRGLFSRPNFYTVLPLAIAFAVWFAYPPKIRSTLVALINRPAYGMQHPYSLEGFLFYPKAVLHLSGSIWLSAILVMALAAAFNYWRKPGIRFLIVLVVVQFGIGLVHQAREDRYMFPMVPALVLITGFIFAEWWNVQGKAVLRWIPRLAALVLCAFGATVLPSILRPLGVASHPEVADKIADALSGYDSSLFLSTRDIRDPTPPLLDWQLIVEKDTIPVTHSGLTINLEEDRKVWSVVQNLSLPLRLKSELQRVMMRAEQPAKTRSLYVGMPPEASYSSDPQKFGAFLRSMDANSRFDNVAVVTMLNANSRYPLDFVDEGIRVIGFEHVSTQSISGSNLQLDLYRRTP